MTARYSTALVNKMLDTGSFKATLASCFIDIYSGAQPADANAAPTGTKLVTISVASGGTGMTWDAAAAGVLPKNSGEVWSGNAIASGTAGWFRIRVAADDLGATGSTYQRCDGSVATSGGEMTVGSLTVTSGAPFVVDAFNVTLPLV